MEKRGMYELCKMIPLYFSDDVFEYRQPIRLIYVKRLCLTWFTLGSNQRLSKEYNRKYVDFYFIFILFLFYISDLWVWFQSIFPCTLHPPSAKPDIVFINIIRPNLIDYHYRILPNTLYDLEIFIRRYSISHLTTWAVYTRKFSWAF